MRATSATGTEREFSLSIEGILAVEAEDPSFRLLREMTQAQNGRISSCDKLCRAMGLTWAEFVSEGFSFRDFTVIITDVIEDLGFTSASMTVSEEPVRAGS